MKENNLILDGKCTTQEFWKSMNSHAEERTILKKLKKEHEDTLVKYNIIPNDYIGKDINDLIDTLDELSVNSLDANDEATDNTRELENFIDDLAYNY